MTNKPVHLSVSKKLAQHVWNVKTTVSAISKETKLVDYALFRVEFLWMRLLQKALLARACVCILFHLLVSSGCTTSVTYVRSSDQRSFVVSISGASAKFLHLCFWIYHISPPKKKTPADHLLERKRYDIMFALKKMIYIDIGYKSAHYKNDSDRKILKIRRLL